MFDRLGSNVRKNPVLASLSMGAAGAGIGSLFSNYKNPADQAFPFMQKAEQTLPQYYNPYIQAGQRAQPGLEQAYGDMMNPNELIKRIGGGYQESPGYQFSRDQAMRSMNNAQAAGGMLGSPQHEQEAGTLATNLANQDFYNYLQQALGQFNQGVQGKQGLYNTGAQASMGLGDNLASLFGNEGMLRYEGQNTENQHEGGQMGGMFGGLMSLLPFFLGG